MFGINNFLLVSDSLNKNNELNYFSMLGPLFLLIFISLVLFFIAYYLNKGLLKSKFTINKSSNIRVIESFHTGFQNSIQILKVGQKYILIAVSKEKISFLCELNKDDLDLIDLSQQSLNLPFDKYLSKYFKKNNDLQ